MKLWAGRFSKETDSRINDFNASITFDSRMVRQDIQGSIAQDVYKRQAGQLAVIPDGNILVGDDVVQGDVLADDAALHHDAVAHNRSPADLDPAEDHAVLHLALDDAAIGHQGVGHLGRQTVLGGDLVPDLGVDGPFPGIELLPHRSVQQVHIGLHIAAQVLDPGGVLLLVVAVDPQAVHPALEHILGEGGILPYI